MIVRERAGRWFVTFQIREKNWEAPEKKTVKKVVGIDLGLTRLATLSDGEIILNPRNFKLGESKLARLNQNLARAKRGSCRRRKTKRKLAAQHMKISDRRKDYLHKLTTRLVKENDCIVLEDLNVAGMKKLFGKSVSDVALGEVRRQIEYKSEWYGTTLIMYPRFKRSTGVCSCGYQTTPLGLKVREWDCPCGLHHDRDLAAAQVLEEYGWKVLQLLAADTSVIGDWETGLEQVDEACETLVSRQTNRLTKVNGK